MSERATETARRIVADWAAIPSDDIGFEIEGAWTYRNLVERIAAALREAGHE